MSVALIDADGIAYRIACAIQESAVWDDDVVTSWADLYTGKQLFALRIEELLQGSKCTEPHLCWSCSTRHYFRHDVLPSYKGGRKSGVPPVALKPLREWAKSAYTSWERPNLEADDVLGILATSKIIKGRKVIISPDKDLLQIPGEHYDQNTDKLFTVTEENAEYALWYQVLTGDATDGYSGLPGCGPVKAKKILSGKEKHGTSLYELVMKAYEDAGLTESDLAKQVNVARILHAADYDFENKEPELWQTW